MNLKEIWQEIELTLRQDKKLNPNYPDHICGQAGMVVEEAGYLMTAANDIKYRRPEAEILQQSQIDKARKAAIATAAAAIRFLENFKS